MITSNPFGFVVFLMLMMQSMMTAQETLREQLAVRDNLNEIAAITEAWFAKHPVDEKAFESAYTHWKRWEWYMSGRTNANGDLVNIAELLLSGLAEKEKMGDRSTARNINSHWTQLGPSRSPYQNVDAQFNGIGRTNHIVFHPTNAEILYLCTPNGGLWRTLNGGDTWTNLTDHLPSIAIADCVVSYANPDVIFLLTGDGQDGFGSFGYGQPSVGILRSTDNGVSWHPTGILPGTPGEYFGAALEQSPTDHTTLIAATSAGLYRTTDSGNTWTQEEAGNFHDVKFKPGDGNTVYATKQGRMFYRSTDEGNTWTANSTFDVNLDVCNGPGGDRLLIATAPTNVARVYLLSAPRLDPGAFCGVWRSSDSGVSFSRQTTTPNIFGTEDNGSDSTDFTSYCMAIVTSPVNSLDIFAGGCTIWRSSTGGASWEKVTSYSEAGAFPYIHPDVHGLAFNPLNHFLYAATDGGIYVSEDFGDTWDDLTLGIEGTQIYHMAGWDGNINKLMIGSQDNGIKYRKDNTSDFYHLNCCDGFDVVFNVVTGHPAYASSNNAVRKHSSDGMHSGNATPDNDRWFKTLAVHNTDTSIVLVGTGDGIFRSLNSGADYTNEGVTGSWALTACPSNNARFYAAGGENFEFSDGGLYMSANTGDTWTIKSTNPGFPDQSLWNKITDVVPNPLNSLVVYASFGGFEENAKVVRSSNGGDTWTNFSLNLPNVPVNCLAVDNSDGVYAGTDIGVFYKSASMSEWMPFSNALPNVPVTELVIFDDGTNKKLRAATYGRGVWQSDLAQSCDASVVVIGSLQGIRHYEASASITSPAFVQGGIGTFVSYQAGDFITLSEGFRVIDESEFLGMISPCGDGGIPDAQGESIERIEAVASVIPMRRMWDPETGLPYGSIHQVQVDSKQITLTYDTRKTGLVELVLAKPVQDALITIHKGEVNSGKHTVSASLEGVEQGFYHALLFYEGKLVHFQEVDLRP